MHKGLETEQEQNGVGLLKWNVRLCSLSYLENLTDIDFHLL
jgi:hypothetical protein